MNSREKSFFYRQLSQMLESGLPLISAVDSLLSSRTTTHWKNNLVTVRKKIAQGIPLSISLAETFGDQITELEKAAIKLGEVSGSLAEVFKNLAEYFEFLTGIKTRLITGLLYPVILLHAAIIIPAFPLLILKGAGVFLAAVCPFFLLFYGPVIIFKLLPRGKIQLLQQFFSRTALRIPVLGGIFSSLALLRFYQAWLCLYSAGLGVMESIPLAARATGNKEIEESLLRAQIKLHQGKTLQESFAESPYLPETAREFIKTGEISGRLDESLTFLVNTTKQELNTRMERLLTVLPVAVYLLVAVYTAFVIISFYLGYFREINSFLN